MLAYALCLTALFACFKAARRSHVTGLCALMTVGYGYGIIRANAPEPVMHFVFDFGVAGLFAGLFSRGLTPAQSARIKVLRPWIPLLVGWPVLLFLLPLQDFLIQLVGLRGQIYFLPFILIGAMIEPEDCYRLARWFAIFNMIAFGFALAEYIAGVPRFYPRNANTAIIYASKDVLENGSVYRIPATFVNPAAFSGMMVGTLPLLLGAWTQRRRGWLNFYLLSAALAMTGLGIFMGASRSQALIAIAMLAGAFLIGHLSLKVLVRSAIALACVVLLVAHEPRLQRFATIDAGDVAGRVGVSVNDSFLTAMIDYPMGNGLGGGGTSVPFFLRDRLVNPVVIENEYGRILLEQGIPGLLIWVVFFIWVIISPLPHRDAGWLVTLKLLRVYLPIAFVAACIGTGLMTSIPQTPLMLMFIGLFTTARAAERIERSTQLRSPVYRSFAVPQG